MEPIREFDADTIDRIAESTAVLFDTVVALTEKFVLESTEIDPQKLEALEVASRGGMTIQMALEWLIAQVLGVSPFTVAEWFGDKRTDELQFRAESVLEAARARLESGIV